MDTKLVGDIAVTQLILKSLQLGYKVSLPYGDRFKYDLILDVDNVLHRIQVKKAYKHKNSNCYTVKTKKSNTNRRQVKYVDYKLGDFDFACVYIDELNIFYVIPAQIYTSKNWTLTITPTNSYSLMNAYKEAWYLLHRAASEEIQKCEDLKFNEAGNDVTLSEILL